MPRVSILLPAWNEAAHLTACLESILALCYPAVELVVCAGGSDSTLDIAQSYANRGVIVMEQRPGEGKQRALQRCFDQSTGEIIFLTDADCLLNDYCFEATIAPLAVGEEEVTTGFWEPLGAQKGLPFVQYQWAHHIHREILMPMYADTLDGRNAAVRRDALGRSGAFQANAPTGTDYVLSRQLVAAGYRIRAVPWSRVQTEYPQSYREYWRQQSRWFRNRLVLGARTRSQDDVRLALRSGIASLLLLGGPLAALRWRVLWLPWLGLTAQALLSYEEMLLVAQECDDSLGRKTQGVALLAYLPVGWVGQVLGLLDAVWPSSRRRW
jgi:cellulose synthase/poly-beta-1,6-N-acetylglucosamine synthase-like glycosyltransferase